jgi:bleomycin hydrolase
MNQANPQAILTQETIEQFRTAFENDPVNRLAQDAITRVSVHTAALNHETAAGIDHTFSVLLPSNEATAQEKSGRCWLFSGLNTFRSEGMKRLNVEKFELSQTYLMFWDKLEKANYFLESILSTLSEPVDGRLLMHLLSHPLQDGGQWDMFCALVGKYGVVPRSVMPETESSSNSTLMNSVITAKLREYAAELRRLAATGDEEDVLRSRKDSMMTVIYRMLAIHLGTPPTDFFWQWWDKSEAFHRDGVLTPLEFLDRYIGVDLQDKVCLINCPTPDKPMNHLYTIGYLGNVVEARGIRYLNTPVEAFKQAAIDMLVAGRPVWFGCDVGKFEEKDLGILDPAIYDYDLVYGEGLMSGKAERIMYGQSLMTHAMVLTGVDLDGDGHARKWRVENSWGDKLGDKGFFVMTDTWFDEYVYEVAVSRDYLSDDLRAVLREEPTVLPPWDPMGALAAAR